MSLSITRMCAFDGAKKGHATQYKLSQSHCSEVNEIYGIILVGQVKPYMRSGCYITQRALNSRTYLYNKQACRYRPTNNPI